MDYKGRVSNMERIDITRYYKDLKINMCVMEAYSVADMDYEFSITGNNLPMVRIGKISAYCDGGKLILDDFEDVIGSDIYATLSYGRICQAEEDIHPSYTEIFEVGVHHGIYDIADSKYNILNYNKDEIISLLFDMAKECQREYIKTLNITHSDVKHIAKILRGREGNFGIRYYKHQESNLVLGDEYGFGLCEVNIKKDMSLKDIIYLILDTLQLNLENTEEDLANRELSKCCGTCTEFTIEEDNGYRHCTHYGIPVDMFTVACENYGDCRITRNGVSITEEILDVKSFVF